MNHEILKKVIEELELPKYRLGQILKFYYQRLPKNWSEVKVLPKELLAEMETKIPFNSVKIIHTDETEDVIKFVFAMLDGGAKVEAVLMKHNSGKRTHKVESLGDEFADEQVDERMTLCLSCQAGCPMGCYFCATGTMGLLKNLSEYEIVDMVREVNVFLSSRQQKINNIVYMGMGEPLANYQPVKKSIEILHNPDYFGFGWRRISVSTCGVVPKILEFANDFPQVNLAISLHSAIDAKRSQLMPINDRFNLNTLMQTARQYAELTRRKIFFEYLVIDNFNDQLEDVKALRKLFSHKLYHLNLIRFHATTAVKGKYGVTWQAPTRASLEKFMEMLKQENINFTLRRSFGERIDAACGMLVINNEQTKSVNK